MNHPSVDLSTEDDACSARFPGPAGIAKMKSSEMCVGGWICAGCNPCRPLAHGADLATDMARVCVLAFMSDCYAVQGPFVLPPTYYHPPVVIGGRHLTGLYRTIAATPWQHQPRPATGHYCAASRAYYPYVNARAGG